MKLPSRMRPVSRGQATVEFVLVLPLMLLILVIAIDFGRLFFTYVAVTNAAREGANYAAAHAADTPFVVADYNAGVTATAAGETNSQAQGGTGTLLVSAPSCFRPGTPPTTIDCHTASNFEGGIGNQVIVTVTQPFNFATPIIGSLFGSLTLGSSATAPVLNPMVAEFITTSTSTSTTTTSTTTTSTTTTSTTTTSTTTPCVAPVVTVSPPASSGGNKDTTIDVHYTATITNGPATSWAWDFGDGTTSTLATPSHTFTYTGTIGNNGHGNGPHTWTVTLTVTTTPNCSGVRTATVTLNP